MTNSGKVLSLNGSRAEVEVIRNTACAMMHEGDTVSSCEGCEGCSSSLRRMTVEAENEAKASVGDVVELFSESKGVLLLSALVFAVPLAVLIGGYLLVSHFAGDLWGFLAGAGGMALCFVLLRVFDQRLSAHSQCRITRILSRAEK